MSEKDDWLLMPPTIWNKPYGEPGCMATAASLEYARIRGIHGDHGFYESINCIYQAMRQAIIDPESVERLRREIQRARNTD